MKITNRATLLIAGREGPPSETEAEQFREEAKRVMGFANDATVGDAHKQELIGDLRKLIRRLPSTDVVARNVSAWLRQFDPKPTRKPVPVTAPVEQSAPKPASNDLTEIESPTAEQLAAARTALDVATTKAHAMREDLAQKTEVRLAAKRRALETNRVEDWSAYHLADRAVVDAELRNQDAADDVERLEQALAKLTNAANLARFRVPVDRSGDEALTSAVVEAVKLSVEMHDCSERRKQVLFAVVHMQNAATEEAYKIGREIGLTRAEIDSHLVRGELGGASTNKVRTVAEVANLVSRMTLAQLQARVAREAAE